MDLKPVISLHLSHFCQHNPMDLYMIMDLSKQYGIQCCKCFVRRVKTRLKAQYCLKCCLSVPVFTIVAKCC